MIDQVKNSKSENSRMNLYDFLNKYKSLYLFFGMFLFAGGSLVLAMKKDYFIYEALGHFQLILGEALIVFFIINVVLEKEARQTFVDTISNIVHQQEKQLVNSVTSTTEEVKRQEHKLTQTISNLFESVKEHEIELKAAFKKTEIAFKSESEKFQNNLNNEFFKIILSERTCQEIATHMNNIEYFKPDFLFNSYNLKLNFSYNKSENSVILVQEDEFTVKNFAKEEKYYRLRFSTFATEKRTYEYQESGVSINLSSNYSHFKIDDFDMELIQEFKGGLQYDLKSEHRPLVKPGESTRAYLILKTTFSDFTGIITDYSFTNLYMMPSTIEVTFPKGFEFALFPTFPSKISSEFIRKETILYKVPFITPGQGYNFSLIQR